MSSWQITCALVATWQQLSVYLFYHSILGLLFWYHCWNSNSNLIFSFCLGKLCQLGHASGKLNCFSRTVKKRKHKWHALINETGKKDIVWHSLKLILIITPKFKGDIMELIHLFKNTYKAKWKRQFILSSHISLGIKKVFIQFIWIIVGIQTSQKNSC